jgi:hypothetical protein
VKVDAGGVYNQLGSLQLTGTVDAVTGTPLISLSRRRDVVELMVGLLLMSNTISPHQVLKSRENGTSRGRSPLTSTPHQPTQ